MTREPARHAVALPGACFEGHFPGRPILPGVGLLHLALGVLEKTGVTGELSGITSLRLRRTVAPEDLLELEVTALDPGGGVRLALLRAGEVVANAGLNLGAVTRTLTPIARADPFGRFDGLFDHDLLPHRPPMRFIEGIEALEDEGITCAVRLPAVSVFANEGSAPALVAVEMAAQSAAAFEALRRPRLTRSTPAPIGYLVGARDVLFARARIPSDTTLTATIRLTGIAEPLSIYAFDVCWKGEPIAVGTISVWITARDV